VIVPHYVIFIGTVAINAPNPRTRRGRYCCSILLAILAAPLLRASSPPPTSVCESLEWLTRTSELIVIGRPISVSPDVVRTDGSHFDEDAKIKIERVLAGELADRTVTFRWRPDRRVYMKYWLEQEKQQPNVRFDFHMVFFLNRASNADGNPPMWTMRADLHDCGDWKTAIGNWARSTDTIAAAIEGELAYMREHRIAPLRLKPETFERTKTLAMYGAVVPPRGSILLKIAERDYVIVPAYPQFQQQALDLCRSSDMRERQRGVFMLRSYPDKVSLEMLMSLLNDDSAYQWNMSSNTACATYVVRAAAYDTLLDRGISVSKPLLDDCRSQ
jgi:hypothetical protein